MIQIFSHWKWLNLCQNFCTHQTSKGKLGWMLNSIEYYKTFVMPQFHGKGEKSGMLFHGKTLSLLDLNYMFFIFFGYPSQGDWDLRESPLARKRLPMQLGRGSPHKWAE